MSLFPPRDTIWEAARRGDLEAVRKFVQRNGFPPMDEKDFGLRSLLTVACEAGHPNIVRFLRESGVRSIDSPYYNPEAFVAMRGDHLEVLRILCKSGLSPDTKEYSKHGESLIDQAVEERRIEVVRLLLAHGGTIYTGYEDETTDEEYENRHEPSPIELAARAGDSEFVTFLLEVGVDLQGQTPDYYLLKAKDNESKHERLQKDEAERTLQNQQSANRIAERQGAPLLPGCLTFILGIAILGYIFRQLFVAFTQGH